MREKSLGVIKGRLKPTMQARARTAFPLKLLVHAPIAASAIAAALWLALSYEVQVDLISNWLAVPCLVLLAGVGLLQVFAVPFGVWRASQADAWHRPGVWLALLCGSGYFLLVAYLALSAIYVAV